MSLALSQTIFGFCLAEFLLDSQETGDLQSSKLLPMYEDEIGTQSHFSILIINEKKENVNESNSEVNLDRCNLVMCEGSLDSNICPLR